jgi:hypothetical protein
LHIDASDHPGVDAYSFMGAVHFNSLPYTPPSSVKKLEGVCKFESLSYLIQKVGTGKKKVRIFFFHGNADDIFTSDDTRLRVLGQIHSYFPIKYQQDCEVTCISIDYPTYGRSEYNKSILGEEILDAQIERLFQYLKGDDINCTWSYSIGTRYAAVLMNNSEIDLGYFQAPYFSIEKSCASLLGSLYTGPPGWGLCALQWVGGHWGEQNIFLHMSEADEIFPPDASLNLMKPLCKNYIIEKGLGKGHGWFTTPEGADSTACVLGGQIGEILQNDDLLQSLAESSLSPPTDHPPSSSSEEELRDDDSSLFHSPSSSIVR